MFDLTTWEGLVSSILGAALFLLLVFIWRSIKGRLERVLGQTENSHQDTEYPNMRDEITAIRLLQEESAKAGKETAAAVGSLAKTVAEDRQASRTETEGVRADLRAVAQRVDLHIAASAAQQAQPPDPS